METRSKIAIPNGRAGSPSWLRDEWNRTKRFEEHDDCKAGHDNAKG
jgi:hypothetical protein